MSARGRRLAVFLPIIVTIVLAGVVGALVVVKNQQQTDQVSRAEDIGNDYLRDVSDFRARVVKAINDADEGDPGKLGDVVDAAIRKQPVLGDATSYGRDHSEVYAQALQARTTFLAPYRRLSRELRRADVALGFIKAARTALELRATDYVGFGPITSSGPVRSELIPAFVRARDTFAKVRVPKGQDELAAQVRDALQYVIDQATTLADRLDRFQGFSFSYSEQFKAALDAVEGYATTVKGDVAEATNAITEDG